MSRLDRPPKYWLGKLRLWFILHPQEREQWPYCHSFNPCELCHHYHPNAYLVMLNVLGPKCDYENNPKRLFVMRFLNDVYTLNNRPDYDEDFHCIEWIRNV